MVTSYQSSRSKTWPQKWTSARNSASVQLDYMEVSSSSSRYLTIYTAGVLLLLGDYWKITTPLFWAWCSLSDGLTISKYSFSILPWEMLHQNIFFFQLKIQFLHHQLVWKFLFWKFYFFTQRCFMLPSEKQKCSMPVSGWLDLNFPVSLN